ncbi:DUF2291 family protein [Sandaracinomonas limnophila]|uniref:DUF2291 family protein n=1 Tax=Sandaracinomonas limnophila TaxID=1862386 RepID=A0A437PP15_9BACT|nr:DUF2291 family protein [Sandaracinomonas limnophila]RVU24043.1 DUF2291 family protein [Sandaracinomonas limnophila]
MLRKILISVIAIVLVTQSVRFEKLSEHVKTAAGNADYANFTEKVKNIIQKGVLENSLLTEESQLIKQLNNNLTNAKKELGNRLGIGESAYFLVKGKSTIASINENEIQLANGSVIDTQFIFGNEIRDASRMVKLEDFKSQKDLNALTEALNKHVREVIIPQEIKGLKVGDNISYIGACEVAPTDIPVKALTIYPVEIKH